MSPKTAIIILLTLTVLIGAALAVFYLERQSRNNLGGELPAGGVVPLSEQKQLTPEEIKQLEIERQVETKVEEKYRQIEQQAANRSLTQDEVNFILSPRQTVAEELGVKLNDDNQTVEERRHLSQEEIEVLLNSANSQ